MVWHGGRSLGMRATVGMIPEEEVGVVVLTNRAPEGLGGPLMVRIFDAYLGAPETDWAVRADSVLGSLEDFQQKREAKLREARVENSAPSLDRAAYTGTYRNELYGTVEVNRSQAGLHIELMDSYSGELSHWHFDTFRVQWDSVAMQALPLQTKMVTFSLDPWGNVTKLELPLRGTFEAVESDEDSTGG